MKKLLPLFLFLSLLAIYQQSIAQNQYTISGRIIDSQTGETLIGANVYVPIQQSGTVSNTYGFYSLSLEEKSDSITVVYSFVGYNKISKMVLLNQDLTLDISLSPEGEVLGAVEIKGETVKSKVNSTQMSVDKLTMKEAKEIPALFGEVDILKVLQLKPGVQSGGEGTSGLYVRGGGPDQNLIILDEATVYNASHLFGFFSTFNADAVKDVELYKGDFPARYGGRLSSVIDVKLRDGNKKKLSGTGGIGLITSRLTLEGPILKDKASFIVSGRRTYFDIFTRQINRMNSDNPSFSPIPDYYFYDLNAKVNYDIGPKDRIFASGYFGRDVFGFGQGDFNFDFSWGNSTGTVRWNHIFNPKLFSNTSVIFSDYNYEVANKFDNFKFELGSAIRDFNVKNDFYYAPDKHHTVRFGVNANYHQFTVGRVKFEQESNDSTGVEDTTAFSFNQSQKFKGTELGLYVSDDYEVNSQLTLNAGLRVSAFTNDGQFYSGFEPRLSLKYSLSESVALKASYTRMFQYIHLVSNSGASLPTDVWYPSNKVVQPQRSNQVVAGVSAQIGKQFFFSNEVYYKWMNNQIDFRDGARIFLNPNLDDEFVFGKGQSYGNEIYIEKKEGRLTGWAGYTLSWTFRQFDDIMNGKKFFPRYDRRHDISILGSYKISKRLTATAAWVYGTGNAITLATGRFLLLEIPGVDPLVVPDYLERNSFRMNAYHRMDLAVVWRFFPKWGESDLTFSVYNVYNRLNPYFIYYDEVNAVGSDEVLRYVPKQVSLFPIIPSVTYNFSF